jgi:pimeloyl-ACP methyl ester carboxylesterase
MDIALVHGSYHGAWCWEFLTPELERLGHHVITMDLPVSELGLGAADYATTVEEALDPASVPVLVGHSMAGLITPLVATPQPSSSSRTPHRRRALGHRSDAPAVVSGHA